MKNLFKKLLTIAATLAFMAATFAATATFPLGTTTGTTSLVPNKSGAITSITFVNADAALPATIAFYNAPTNVLTYVIGAYTNSVVTAQVTITSFTNYLGRIQYATNNTITTTLTPVAQTTNNYPTLLTYIVPAASSVQLPMNPYLNFFNGLAINNSITNVAVTVQYLPAQ